MRGSQEKFGDNCRLTVVAQITAALPEDRKAIAYDYRDFWQPQPGEKLLWQQALDVADVAIVDVSVHPEAGFEAQAQASVLRGHFRTAAFDKLRTEEQLAYAVGGAAVQIGDYTGFAMYIQTPVKDVEAMQARFDTFKQEYVEQLNSMTEETFAQLKASTLVTLKEPPKNLQDEVTPFMADWYKENYDFVLSSYINSLTYSCPWPCYTIFAVSACRESIPPCRTSL